MVDQAKQLQEDKIEEMYLSWNSNVQKTTTATQTVDLQGPVALDDVVSLNVGG